MGRIVDLKKIIDVTKCQVTFSKRRSSLMRKTNEISVCCDIDVVFVAFSPSGRVSKFCNQRIEDVLCLYVNLPTEIRLNHINNVENKLEKLRHLDHITSDASKLQFLDKQIENLELQIKKSGLELQILEADLRDYEWDPEQEPSLHQLSWCERNINYSLERVIARKNALGDFSTSCTQPNFQVRNQMLLRHQDDTLFSPDFNENEQNLPTQNLKFDPWIMSSQSAKVGDNIIQDLFDQTNLGPNTNFGQSNIFNLSHSPVILESGNMVAISNVGNSSFQIPQQQPILVGQTLLDSPQQNIVNAWNNHSSVTYSTAIEISTENLCPIEPSRLTSTPIITSNTSDVIMPQHEPAQSGLQTSTWSFNQFNNMVGGEIDHENYMSNNLSNNNVDEGDHLRTIGYNKVMNTSHQSDGLYQVDPQKGLCQQEDAFGDNTLMWTTKIQKTNIWEWDDFLLDENFNFKNSK